MRHMRHILAGVLVAVAVGFGTIDAWAMWPFLVLAFIPLLIRWELHLDLDKRRYRLLRGLLPFAITEGEFRDLYAVELERLPIASEYSDSFHFSVKLRWVGNLCEPWQLARYADLKSASIEAQKWAERLGLSLTEGPKLTNLRRELSDVVITPLLLTGCTVTVTPDRRSARHLTTWVA